jgi:hypothetical protein
VAITTKNSSAPTATVKFHNKVDVTKNASNLITMSWSGWFNGTCNNAKCDLRFIMQSNSTHDIIVDNLDLSIPNANQYNSVNISVENGFCEQDTDTLKSCGPSWSSPYGGLVYYTYIMNDVVTLENWKLAPKNTVVIDFNLRN